MIKDMKKIFLFTLMIFTSIGNMYANNIFLYTYERVKLKLDSGILKAPSQGETITSLYDYSLNKLIVSFYAMMDNVEVTITKDGEPVASDVFNMNAYEGIEYDMSECEKGEYVVYVVTDGAMQVLGSFYKE